MRPPDRAAAAGVAVLGGVTFVVLAWWLVPWDPVPGGPVEPVAASEVFTAAEIARAEHFSFWARVWGWSSLALSLAVVCWLGFTTAGQRLVQRLPGPWWAQVALAVVVVELVRRLASLPLSAAGHRNRVDAGLSTQPWVGWLRDVAVSEGIETLVTATALVVVVALARRWRRIWPALAAAFLGGLVMLGSFVYPVVVEPLFNDFASLPAGELRTEVLELAERMEVELDDVLVADASRRTTTLNAYVSGYGSTRRVVVYDTLLDGAEQDQVLVVTAHELAHAAKRDVLVGTVLGVAGTVSAVGLLILVLQIRSRGSGAVTDPRSVPTVLALLALFTLAAAPVENTISRKVELRADVESLAVTDDPHAFVGLQRTFTLRSLSDPTPPALSQIWFGSHPTVLQRLGLIDYPLQDADA
ncbi:M48 family metalloprotease [Nocardioides coralli]|uniref:M48 family metalloprotease n=1 Tax=Nocardioides coralli TaxID=2872154 RepID=UPI001CA41A41|nr:M48 family metalloprotease [Nocardioides coralli]QZY28018.1 M48 family metalloprotease [Nocardioides coralli]